LQPYNSLNTAIPIKMSTTTVPAIASDAVSRPLSLSLLLPFVDASEVGAGKAPGVGVKAPGVRVKALLGVGVGESVERESGATPFATDPVSTSALTRDEV